MIDINNRLLNKKRFFIDIHSFLSVKLNESLVNNFELTPINNYRKPIIFLTLHKRPIYQNSEGRTSQCA